MNERQETIVAEYLSELGKQGVRIASHKSPLGIFFEYASNTGLDFLRLTISEAQGFQAYLATRTNEGGKAHYSKATVSTIIDRLRRFYDFLKKKRIIHANPFREIQGMKRMKTLPRNILNESDMNRFLTHLRSFWKGATLFERRKLYRAHVIAELMYSTGARINEVMKITADDVDFTRGLVSVKDDKTGKSRQCMLNEYASRVLRIYMDDMRSFILSGKANGLLFGAGPSLVVWLNAVLTRESVKLGLSKVTSHHFRHAVGFHLLRAGCDIRYIKEILGHEELGTTQVYTKVDKLDLRNIIDRFHPRKMHSCSSEVEAVALSGAEG